MVASVASQAALSKADLGESPPSPQGDGERAVLFSFQGFDPRRLDASGLSGDAPRHLQIGRGPLQGEANRFYFDSCAIRIGSFSETVRVDVQLPADRVTLGLVLEAREPIRVFGKALRVSNLTVLGAGEAAECLFNAGARWVTFNLPAGEYAEAFATADNPQIQQPRNAPRFHPDAEAVRRVRSLLADVETSARDQPSLFGDSRWRLNAERSLRNGFLDLLEGATLLHCNREEARVRSSIGIVRAVEARLAEDLAKIPSVGALCQEFRLSRRTLERAFQEVTGCSPAANLRILALNAVRRELLAATPEPGIVARVAIDNGFWHFGRFAGSYRALFGERPVDTLRNR